MRARHFMFVSVSQLSLILRYTQSTTIGVFSHLHLLISAKTAHRLVTFRAVEDRLNVLYVLKTSVEWRQVEHLEPCYRDV